MRAELALTIATVAGGAVLVLFACGFPDPVVENEGTPDGATSSSGEASTSDGGDGSSNEDVDAAPPLICDDADCDCDKDGQKKKGACGGLDCWDFDPDAKDGQQSFVTKKPTGGFDGDWNCDNNVTKQYLGNVPNDCNLHTASEADCTGRKGFTGPQPNCGESAEFRACVWNPANIPACADGPLKTEVQGCR